MTWNYRLIRYSDDEGFGLHRVFYDPDGRPTSMTELPCGFAGESKDHVLADLARAAKDAAVRPILDEAEIPETAE